MKRQFYKFYSTSNVTQQSIKDLLPPKKIISRLLFDYNARYNFHKYLPVIESIYNSNDCKIDKEIPIKFDGTDLMVFQRVLAQIRKQTHTINPKLLKLENDLIEIAAERGSRDALTTLSFMALDDPKGEFRDDDKEAARGFLKKLIELKHPLVFKMAGDRELRGISFNSDKGSDISSSTTTTNTIVNSQLLPTEDIPMNGLTTSSKHLSRSISFYNEFLKLDSNSILSGSAHRSLGMIYFRLRNLTKSFDHFQRAIQLSPESDNSQAHFFLGLLNEHDPILSRYHFQISAGEGFRESFSNLGYLELNIFKDSLKAKEWFKLGAELGVNECIIGLFDTANRLGDFKDAFNIITRADKLGVGKLLRRVRSENVKKVENEIYKGKKGGD